MTHEGKIKLEGGVSIVTSIASSRGKWPSIPRGATRKHKMQVFNYRPRPVTLEMRSTCVPPGPLEYPTQPKTVWEPRVTANPKRRIRAGLSIPVSIDLSCTGQQSAQGNSQEVVVTVVRSEPKLYGGDKCVLAVLV